MAPNKRTCPNGHKYDSSIYGDNCPFCPSPTQLNNSTGYDSPGGRTQVNGPSTEATRPTIPVGPAPEPPAGGGGHTVIRSLDSKDTDTPAGRRIVGLLVSFSANPCGKVYNLYEGRNTIGRDITNDIAFPNDNAISQRHLVIVYRASDNRYLMEDQLTSNGTWLNGETANDRVSLNSGDIVVIGATKFVFLSIPQGL
ncbi:MAG: FHA domain-containing protein [Clostridium sp.]|nr:FHA domain-containing protein [Clostridium sp.]